MTTIQQFYDDALEGFKVKLADRNAVEALQESRHPTSGLEARR